MRIADWTVFVIQQEIDHWLCARMNDHRTALRPIKAVARSMPTTSSRSVADVSSFVAMTIPSCVVLVRTGLSDPNTQARSLILS